MGGRNQSVAETLRSWRGLYRAALFETDASRATIAHRRSPASNGLSIPRAFCSFSQLRRRDRGYRECPLCSQRTGELFEIEHKRSQARSANLL